MQLDHIAINVEHIQTSIDWYVLNLGAKVLYSDETWGLLQVGQTKLALTVPHQHPPHIAFTVDELSDVPGVASVHRDGSISSYIEDPDGNSIEYIYWPPKT